VRCSSTGTTGWSLEIFRSTGRRRCSQPGFLVLARFLRSQPQGCSNKQLAQLYLGEARLNSHQRYRGHPASRLARGRQFLRSGSPDRACRCECRWLMRAATGFQRHSAESRQLGRLPQLLQLAAQQRASARSEVHILAQVAVRRLRSHPLRRCRPWPPARLEARRETEIWRSAAPSSVLGIGICAVIATGVYITNPRGSAHGQQDQRVYLVLQGFGCWELCQGGQG